MTPSLFFSIYFPSCFILNAISYEYYVNLFSYFILFDLPYFFHLIYQDIFAGKDAVLGYVTINLSTYYCSPKVEIDAWYDLMRANGDDSSVVSSVNLFLCIIQVCPSFSVNRPSLPVCLSACPKAIFLSTIRSLSLCLSLSLSLSLSHSLTLSLSLSLSLTLTPSLSLSLSPFHNLSLSLSLTPFLSNFFTHLLFL